DDSKLLSGNVSIPSDPHRITGSAEVRSVEQPTLRAQVNLVPGRSASDGFLQGCNSAERCDQRSVPRWMLSMPSFQSPRLGYADPGVQKPKATRSIWCMSVAQSELVPGVPSPRVSTQPGGIFAEPASTSKS